MDFNRVSMRKFMIYSILICSSIFIEAQNNLVFNQVLDFRVGPNSPATVPENKVWKVEYYQGNDLRATNTEVPYGSSLNNTSIYQNFNGGNNSVIWFSSGTILSSPNNGSHLSVLEFNVVPISSSGNGTGGGVSSEGLVFEEAITQTLTDTETIGTETRLYGEIVVPENRILKITNISTYRLYGDSSTQDEGTGYIYIGDELFLPQTAGSNFSPNTNPRYFPSGTYTAKVDWISGSLPNRLVVNAILYSKP